MTDKESGLASAHVANKSQGRDLNLDLKKLLEGCGLLLADWGGASGLLQGYPVDLCTDLALGCWQGDLGCTSA